MHLPNAPARELPALVGLRNGPEQAGPAAPSVPEGPEEAGPAARKVREAPEEAGPAARRVPEGPEEAGPATRGVPEGPEEAGPATRGVPEAPEEAGPVAREAPEAPEEAGPAARGVPEAPEEAGPVAREVPEAPEEASAVDSVVPKAPTPRIRMPGPSSKGSELEFARQIRARKAPNATWLAKPESERARERVGLRLAREPAWQQQRLPEQFRVDAFPERAAGRVALAAASRRCVGSARERPHETRHGRSPPKPAPPTPRRAASCAGR